MLSEHWWEIQSQQCHICSAPALWFGFTLVSMTVRSACSCSVLGEPERLLVSSKSQNRINQNQYSIQATGKKVQNYNLFLKKCAASSDIRPLPVQSFTQVFRSGRNGRYTNACDSSEATVRVLVLLTALHGLSAFSSERLGFLCG